MERAARAPGLHILYGFTEHVRKPDRTPGNGALALSGGLFGAEGPRPAVLEESAMALDETGLPSLVVDQLYLFLPRDPRGDTAQGLYNALRVVLVRHVPTRPWFLLTGAGVWDALHHSPGSQLVVAPGVFEYLFSEQGDSDAQGAATASAAGRPGEPNDADAAAWAGAGWVGTRCRRLSQDLGESLPPPSRLDLHLHAALANLVATVDPAAAADPARRLEDYRLALGRFLPPFRGRAGRLIPSLAGSYGGPRRWGGIARLPDPLTQHLLLDGWLGLWTDAAGQLWLQPSSLVTLAWLAWRWQRPHTESPDAFLHGYAWNQAPAGWFGGAWKGPTQNT